jgi:hypothetical protein
VRVASEDRGVKRSRFLVLKEAPCPAVLVECGFVSNKREEEKLLTEAYREALARGAGPRHVELSQSGETCQTADPMKKNSAKSKSAEAWPWSRPLHLKYYMFDWDDNILHMPTRIHLEKKTVRGWRAYNVSPPRALPCCAGK